MLILVEDAAGDVGSSSAESEAGAELAVLRRPRRCRPAAPASATGRARRVALPLSVGFEAFGVDLQDDFFLPTRPKIAWPLASPPSTGFEHRLGQRCRSSLAVALRLPAPSLAPLEPGAAESPPNTATATSSTATTPSAAGRRSRRRRRRSGGIGRRLGAWASRRPAAAPAGGSGSAGPARAAARLGAPAAAWGRPRRGGASSSRPAAAFTSARAPPRRSCPSAPRCPRSPARAGRAGAASPSGRR